MAASLSELEKDARGIEEIIETKDYELKQLTTKGIDESTFKRNLTEFEHLYEDLNTEEKHRLNQLLFSEIVSYMKRGEDRGEIEIHIRADRMLRMTWEDIDKLRKIEPKSTGNGSNDKFAHLGALAPRAGLEPATHRLTADCSAN